MEQALLAALAAAASVGGLWLWALLAAPRSAQARDAVAGGVAVLVACAAAATAAYSAGVARRLRVLLAEASEESSRLEHGVAAFADHVLPAVAKRVRQNMTAEAALAGVPRPPSILLARILQTFARELATTERASAAALAARASIESEATRLAEETMPALLARVRSGTPADVALHELPQPANAPLQRLLGAAAREIGNGERKGGAAMSATAAAAARIQARTTALLADLRELEHRHSEEKVFADLLELDHRISQLGRLADSVALLAGGRSGRRWTKPITIESVLRGAMGRIDAYQRVTLHATSTAAVAGYAAEGVMHALAELLDNAASFSAHGTHVHVYVDDEDAGVVITIEDSGLGMRKRERARAEELIAAPPDLTTLTGTRLGLAVVGRLAAKHGLTVSFRPSSRGGTGVVVLVPRQLITAPRPDERGTLPGRTSGATAAGESPSAMDAVPPGTDAGPPAARAALPRRATAPVGAGRAADAEPAEPADPADPATTDAGSGAAATGAAEAGGELLPRRRRGQTLADAVASRPELERAAALPDHPPGNPAARLAAFRKAGEDARGRGGSAPPEQGD